MKILPIAGFASFWLFGLCVSQVNCVFQGENNQSSDELIFAHLLFRHGDRNVLEVYKNDPWKDEIYWPGGLGQLTNIGRQQHYELGAYLRRRYFKLMNNGIYHRDNIYVRSTDVDRTMMSVSHNLAGMFPPMNGQIWNESLMWQAIPIHVIPEEIDHVLAMKRPCPLRDQASKEYEQSPEIQLILKKHQSLIEYLREQTGDNIQTIEEVKTLYQTLWVEELKNFTLPSWTKKVYFPGSEMEKLANFAFGMETNTKLLARLKAGSLVREILQRFTMKKDTTLSPNRSLWIYSAHDSTVANVLNTLGLFEPHIPGYASCLFLELHKFNGTFHVEIYYKRERGEDNVPLEPLSIPNCGKKCQLSRMYELYKDIIPTEDFDAECRLPNIPDYNEVNQARNSAQRIVSFSFVIVLLALMIVN